MKKLSKEERELLESVEHGEWRSVTDVDQERMRHEAYARGMLKKDQRINIRLSTRDLEALQTLAVEQGIPYQTLIASILHRYVAGSLQDRERVAVANVWE